MNDHHDHEHKHTEACNHASEPDFSLQSIYIKDLSFEAPNNPDIFSHDWDPKVEFDLHVHTAQHDDVHYEVTLHVTVTVKLNIKDAKHEPTTIVAFLSEVKQSGIFTIAGFSKADLEHILHVVSPEVIFPYARETISNLVLKGGFPQLLLPPMNFQAIYEQSKQQQVASTDKVAANAENMDA
jgi:preprotein translocase subunit SecB